jgi:hypothetical protein
MGLPHFGKLAGAEEGDHGGAHQGGQVHGADVQGQQDVAAGQQGGGLQNGGLPGGDELVAGEAVGQVLQALPVAGTAEEDKEGLQGFLEALPQFGEIFHGPLVGLGFGKDLETHDGAAIQTVSG